ncbi:MAG: Ig-like domain-containing protein [Clostridia bacterium]|nr:Ig-like domain-containing protein [Clostridia bacterium]
MKYNFKKVYAILISLMFVMSGYLFAHSGRTDSNGGHKDNQNKSGLGSYHYHCGGYPAHLHENGACPYTSSSTTNQNTITTSQDEKNTEEAEVKVIKIEINENISKMKVGETAKVTATITPENATDKNIEWKSSNEKIATISLTGKIIALEPGKTNITAQTSNGKIDTLEITVEEEEDKESVNGVSTEDQDIDNTVATSSENSNPISGIVGLGLIGGGAYLGYQKYRKN